MPPLMTLLSKRNARLQMIREAVEEKVPAYYRSLKESGKLDQTVAEIEAAMMESYEEGEDRIRTSWAMKYEADTLRHLQDFETKPRELWE